MPVLDVKLGRRNVGSDWRSFRPFVVVESLLVVYQIAAVCCRQWIVAQPRVQPSRTAKRAVIPDFLCVVVHHVLVNRVAVGGAVEPPDLVEAFVGSSKHLRSLRLIEVTEHVPAHVAVERLNPAIVDVELVHTHPVHNTGSKGYTVWALKRNVGPEHLCLPYVGRSKILERVQRRVREHNDFLSGLDGRDNFGAVRQPDTACLVDSVRCPVKRIVLVRPANQHRVQRCGAVVVRAHGKDEP